MQTGDNGRLREAEDTRVECLIVVQFYQSVTAPTSLREVDRVSAQMIWTRGINLTPTPILPLGGWDPVDTVTQDRYEDILFCRKNILFFTAGHELAYVSERRRKALWCGKTLRSGWGASTGRWMT